MKFKLDENLWPSLAAFNLGFEAEHAELYKDPVTGKPRQFDVRASYTSAESRIALAIESKGLTPEYPAARVLRATGARRGKSPDSRSG